MAKKKAKKTKASVALKKAKTKQKSTKKTLVVGKKKTTKKATKKKVGTPKKAAKSLKTPTKAKVQKSSSLPKVGDPAPAFTLLTDRGETVSKDSLLGQRVILYFYPKDNTPGCTRQACEFQENLGVIAGHDAVVIGVSADSGASHQKFRNNYSLSFPLGIDSDLTVAKSFGVWVEKNMYGRKSMGIQRTTFLLDRQGTVAAVWPKVKVDGHVAEVLETLGSVP